MQVSQGGRPLLLKGQLRTEKRFNSELATFRVKIVELWLEFVPFNLLRANVLARKKRVLGITGSMVERGSLMKGLML